MDHYERNSRERVDFCLGDRIAIVRAVDAFERIEKYLEKSGAENTTRHERLCVRVGRLETRQTKLSAVIGFVSFVAALLIPDSIKGFFKHA